MTRAERLKLCLVCTTGYAAVEALLAVAWPQVVAPSPARITASLAIWAALGGLFGLLPRGERLLPLLVLAVSLPHAERIGGPTWLVPVGMLGALVVGLRAPWGSAGIAVVSALAAPLLVERPQDDGRQSSSRPDQVLITIDTLRADAGLSFLPPWVEVDNAVSSAPWTLPAMDSIQTGLPVRRHGGGLPADGGYTRPPSEIPTIAEALGIQGFRTAAFVSNPHLRQELGFARGFDLFVHSDGWVEPLVVLHGLEGWWHRSGRRVPNTRHQRDAWLVDQAIEWWGSTEPGGRYLWVHLLLPHEYQRDPHETPFVAEPNEAQKAAAYQGNVRAVQAEVDRLIAALEGARVIVTSDHGESLGEEGVWGHGSQLSEPQLRVPVWLRGYFAPTGLQFASFDVRGLLLGEELDARDVVEVGGLRHDGTAFGVRAPDGTVTAHAAPMTQGEAMELSPELKSALESIGYLD